MGEGRKSLKRSCLLLKYFCGYCIGFPQAVPDGLGGKPLTMLWLSWGFPKFQNRQFATVFLIILAWLGLNCCKASTATPDIIHTSTGIFLVLNGEDDQLLHLLFVCLSVSKKVLSAS